MLCAKLSTAPIFPVELFDEIFNHYADENLKASSTWALVCRAFIPSSRSRLFSYVSLVSPQCEPFLHLLDSALCTIQPHVKRLHVMDDDSHWILDALPRLACLTCVQSLDLESWDWTALATSGQDTFLQTFRHIHNLNLEDVTFPSFAHLANLLYSLPDLTSLSLIRITCLSSTPPPPPPSVPPPPAPLASLRELRLHGPWPKQRVFDWLLSHDKGPFSVRKIEVIDISPNHTESLGCYLQRLGPALTEFSFRSLPFSDMTELSDHGILAFIRDIDLVHNENLAHLDMRLLRPKTFSAFLHILSQASSGSLRIVSVRMRPFRHTDPDLPDWPALDALLDAPPFAQMEELRIELEPRVPRPKMHLPQIRGVTTFVDMRTLVSRGLTRCHARGILNVVRVGDRT